MSTATPARPTHTNRLVHETSPYLLQHAHNPVDWYPWGPEAFEAARAQDRPIFLSVGYSTCYWCHVMERQSFEDPSIAKEMNARFVNVKVDREERPDVDQLYMTAVQVLTRHGGWPMSVFLTPDLRPFYGGTYFPPTDGHGRPGFVTVLRGIDDAYRNRKGDVEKSASQLVNILRQLAEPPAPRSPVGVGQAFIDTLVARSVADYEPTYGGFGHAPKFPRETLLELLLAYVAPSDGGAADSEPEISDFKSKVRSMLLHALDALAHGGIRDHLGGGFHRYSTDSKWLVPHFEIMLYDNAMLGWVYAEAYRQTRDGRYAAVARDLFDFVQREMTSPDGAFYTAFDAEVDAMEGLSYLWTKPEVDAVLGADDAKRFNRVYGVDRGPNFADPHHGFGVPDKSILYLAEPGPGPQSALLDPDLRRMRQALYDARRNRKQPLLDTKILTSWNALMIRAFAHGGRVLGEPRYVGAGIKAAEFLLTRHRTPDGGLLRTSGGGTTREGGPSHVPRPAGGEPHPPIPGFLDDYAFLTQALLALADAGAGQRWRDEAQRLAGAMTDRFGDSEVGGFYFTDSGVTDLIMRQKTATDSPLPSGNAVAAMALLELGQADAVRDVLAVFAQSLEQNGEGMSSLVQAVLRYLRKAPPFTVSADARAGAEDRPASPQETAATVVSVRPEWVGPRELRLHVSVLDGFHVNAHDIDPRFGLVATSVAVGEGADAASIEYPPGEVKQFAFAEQPIRVYDGEVTITAHFPSPPAKGMAVRFTVTYQACDDSACLPRVTKAIEAPPPPAI